MDRKEFKAYIIAWIVCLVAIVSAILLTSLALANDEIEIQPEYIEITEGPESAGEVLPELEDLGMFRCSYYCSCRKCNGKWGPIDGFGDPLKWGCVAVDPKVIPLHTKLVVDGYDMVFEARDTGGKWVKGKHIDIFVPVSHSEALKMAQGEKLRVWRVKE